MTKSSKIIINSVFVFMWLALTYFYGENNLPADGGEETGFPFNFLTVYANQLEGGYDYVVNYWYLMIDIFILALLIFIINKYLIR